MLLLVTYDCHSLEPPPVPGESWAMTKRMLAATERRSRTGR